MLLIKRRSFDAQGHVISDDYHLDPSLDDLKPPQVFRRTYPNAAWLLVVRTAFVQSCKLYFEKGLLHEDLLWVPLTFMRAARVAVVDTYCYCYHKQRSGSITTAYTIRNAFDVQRVVDLMWQRGHTDAYSAEAQSIIEWYAQRVFTGFLLYIEDFQGDRAYRSLLQAIRKNASYLAHSSCITEKICAFIIKLGAVRMASLLWRKVLRPLRNAARKRFSTIKVAH